MIKCHWSLYSLFHISFSCNYGDDVLGSRGTHALMGLVLLHKSGWKAALSESCIWSSFHIPWQTLKRLFLIANLSDASTPVLLNNGSSMGRQHY